MPNYTFTARSVLLVSLLTACASTELAFDDVAGIYGCEPCSFGGSYLLLRLDGTYSKCMFSDTPQFDGHFSMEILGSYSIDGQRVEFSDDSSEHSTDRYLLGVRGKLYMLTEDVYLEYGDSNEAIENLGLARRSATDNPYVCLK